jgi:hypothetical protein
MVARNEVRPTVCGPPFLISGGESKWADRAAAGIIQAETQLLRRPVLVAVTKPSSLVRVTLGVLQHVVEECQSAATFFHKIQAHGPEGASVWMFDFPPRLLFYSV